MHARWLLGSLLLSACGGDASGPRATIARVAIAPDSVTVSPGDTAALSASARNAAGQAVSGVTLFWSTSDSTIATVTQRGVVAAVANGSARIAASAENVSAYAMITVRPPLVASVKLTPASDSIYATSPGNRVTLTATTKDKSGDVLTGQPLLWSTNTALVTVSNGVVTASGSAAGTAVVTATSPDSGFPAGSAQIIVIGHVKTVAVAPANPLLSTSGSFLPKTVQLSATLTDTFGHNVSGHRTLHWSSANAAVASVDATTGLVTARATADSQTTITATTLDGQTGSVTVTVFP